MSRSPLFFLVVLALLAACSKQPEGGAPVTAASGAAAAGPGASAPPVGVSTVRAVQRDMPVLITATGSVTPLSTVDVRPQTTAPVLQVHVKEGQFVRAGELLFSLDARAAEADLAKARAQMARDEASLADARRQLNRARELLAQNFISQGAVDTNQATFDAQQALVNADRAAVEASRLAVSYTRITAPGAGRIGLISVFPGSLAQANTTTLVSITQLDPIAVAFNLPQRYLGDALTALKNGGAPVKATVVESKQTLDGKLRFVDNAVDASTGTVKVKALFENDAGKLWPGAFVNVAMTARVLAGAVVVPQASIIQNARGSIVYAVIDGKALPRPVEVQYAQGDDAVVTGVKPGERIVLDGRQNLRPGSPVIERSAAGGARAASGAASAAASGPAVNAGNAGNAGNATRPSP